MTPRRLPESLANRLVRLAVRTWRVAFPLLYIIIPPGGVPCRGYLPGACLPVYLACPSVLRVCGVSRGRVPVLRATL
eukprot:7264437-Heterocapsa_arctica.AAC.1